MKARKRAYTPPPKVDERDTLIASLKEDNSGKAQQIDNQRKTITGLQENLKQTADDLYEIAQDYLELAESVGAAFTTAKRIIERHGINRTTVITQGIARRV
jgi:hypothetical protein